MSILSLCLTLIDFIVSMPSFYEGELILVRIDIFVVGFDALKRDEWLLRWVALH